MVAVKHGSDHIHMVLSRVSEDPAQVVWTGRKDRWAAQQARRVGPVPMRTPQLRGPEQRITVPLRPNVRRDHFPAPGHPILQGMLIVPTRAMQIRAQITHPPATRDLRDHNASRSARISTCAQFTASTSSCATTTSPTWECAYRIA